VTRPFRVLAAVDFSAPARGAFEHALRLAQDGELVVLYAIPPDQPFGWHAVERLALEAGLREQADRAGVSISSRVQHGDPSEIVLLHAQALRPDVIVLGTHQRRGVDRLRAGSVGERVLARATSPVLLVPSSEPTAPAGRFRHVAVAVDFSPASDRAVDAATSWATGPRDRLTFLHVASRVAIGPSAESYRLGISEWQDQLLRDDQRRLNRDARRRLADLVARVQPRTAGAVQARLVLGDPATQIRRVVDRIGADLLVVGVPKRGALSRALFGTTAARVLRVTRVPMLALPELAVAPSRHEDAALPLAA
jgi:nucleotide-binding universal stress UspA family protein